MHPISDKELDKLFHQRFGEFEVEPSDMVWGKISNQIDHKGVGKRSYASFWMAAAGIVVVLAAGLWLYRPVEVIKLQGVVQLGEETKPAPSIIGSDQEAESMPLDKEISSNLIAKDIQVPEKKTEESKVQIKSQEDVQPQMEEEVVIATTNKDKIPVIQELKPKVVIPPSDSFDKVGEGDVYAQSLAKPDLTEGIPTDDTVITGQRKIKSIGSLVNFVIAKVDHRENKIIEFKDGDEGTELTGLNLGLVKYRSRK